MGIFNLSKYTQLRPRGEAYNIPQFVFCEYYVRDSRVHVCVKRLAINFADLSSDDMNSIVTEFDFWLNKPLQLLVEGDTATYDDGTLCITSGSTTTHYTVRDLDELYMWAMDFDFTSKGATEALMKNFCESISETQTNIHRV